MHALLVAIRVYEVIVFAIASGLAASTALTYTFRNGDRFRKPFLASFALLLLGVAVGISRQIIIAGQLWNWWSGPLVFASAIFSTYAFFMYRRTG